MSLKRRICQIASILITVSCTIWLVKIPHGSENAFLFGLSLQRTVFLLAFFITCVAQCLFFFVFQEKNIPVWLKKVIGFLTYNPIARAGMIALLAISWYFTFLPVERFLGNQAILTRIKPGIVWMFLQSALLAGRIFLEKNKTEDKAPIEKRALIHGGVFALCAAGLWVFIAQTKIGLTADVFWDNLGVPLTIAQVVLAVIIAAIIAALYCHIFKSKTWVKKENIILFFLIWTITALVWIGEPQQTSTFNPGPFYPNNEFYPNSDAQTYDSCALSVLLGQKYCHYQSNLVSKPFYSAFLLFLHLFSGSSYATLINLQVAFNALLPPLIFLIGTRLHSKPVGILAAVFAILKINNSIANSLVIWTVANPKFLMSEPFLAVLFALFCLFFLLWYQDPQHNKVYLYASAAVLGLTILIRDNVWILFPAFVLIVFVKSYGNGWKKIWRSAMFLFMILLSLAPWMIRNASLGLTPLAAVDKLQYVILGNRYGIEDVDFSESTYIETPTPERTPQDEFRDENKDDVSTSENEPDSANPVLKQAEQEEQSPDIQEQTSAILNSPNVQRIKEVLSSTENHFMHNLMGCFFTLPISYQTGNVRDTIVNTWEVNPWTRMWDGTLNLEAKIFLGINILIVGMGIIHLYGKSRTAYFIPLLLMIFYLIGAGFAKTSGGRYIVPVDWILLLFYAGGILFIIDFLGKRSTMKMDEVRIHHSEREGRVDSNKSATVLLVIFLGIGVLLPVSENIFPEIHFPQTYAEFLAELEQEGYQKKQLPFSTAEVARFLEEDNAVFIAGQGLYPKVFDPSDENANEFFRSFIHEPYTLYFTLLGEENKYMVELPISSTEISFPHGVKTIVLGCKKYVDTIRGLSIVILDQNVEIINSKDLGVLSCE